MTGTGGLTVAVELATRKRDEAGQALAQVLRRHDHALQQLDQLSSYAADTQGRWSVSAQTHTSPQIVGHYYQFMARLDQTIALQQGVIDEAHRQCLAARKVLMEAEVYLAGLQRLLEKRRQEYARLAARREQKQTDEFASRRRTATPDTCQDKP
ncbi:MAG: flagellar export protein FliJ [Burkholderiaceae bacterium]|nr:flagellar export protein FliJ [Rhodoferax sp.]MCB2028242.1 flagellar export protein FliJ [Rhodoferax sp.]MCP5263197.1 flagellar export protein FliJ [Rhodoferax sp.]